MLMGAGIALLLYFAMWGLACWLIAPPLMFRPHPPQVPLPQDTFWLTHPNGERIEARWFGRERYAQARIVILYQHGNAELLCEISARLQTLAAIAQCPVFAYEYRGYGYSQGRARLKNMRQDALLAWNYLRAEGYLPAQMVLYGRSLGSANATRIAVRHPELCALILEVPMWEGIRIYTPWFLTPNGLLRNGQRLGKISAPTLILCAEQDALIAPWHSKRLAAQSAATWCLKISFPCTHSGIPENPSYAAALTYFLRGLRSLASLRA